MESSLEDDLFCFDTNSHFIDASNNVAARQRQSVRMIKRRIVATHALLMKYKQRGQNLKQIQEKLDMLNIQFKIVRGEAQDACKNFENVQEKCTNMEQEYTKLQSKCKALEEQTQSNENREAASESYTKQLKQLLKERESKIDSLRVEINIAKDVDRGIKMRNTRLKNIVNALRRNLCTVADVVFTKRNLNKREKLILYKYMKMRKILSEKEGETIPEEEDLSSDNETVVNDEITLSDIEDTTENVDKVEIFTAKDKNDDFEDNASEAVSVDTGRGTSLALSDSDKCLQSPDYCLDSPFSVDNIKVGDNKKDSSTSPMRQFKQTKEISTSPIMLQDMAHQVHPARTSIIKIDQATSPLKSVSEDIQDTLMGTIDGIEPLPSVPQNKRSDGESSLCDEKSNDGEIEMFDDENSNDCEIEMVLNDMRMSHDVLSPIPPSPTRSLGTRSTENIDLNSSSQLNKRIDDVVLNTIVPLQLDMKIFVPMMHLIGTIIGQDKFKKFIKKVYDSHGSNINNSQLYKMYCEEADLEPLESHNIRDCVDFHEEMPSKSAGYNKKLNVSDLFGVEKDSANPHEQQKESECSSTICDDIQEEISNISADLTKNPTVSSSFCLEDNSITEPDEQEEESDCIILPITQSKLSDKLQFVENATNSTEEINNDADIGIESFDHNNHPTMKAKTKKAKRLTKLDRLRKNFQPKSKIKSVALLPSRKLRTRKIVPINIDKNKAIAALNNKEAYEKAAKVMAELKSKQNNRRERMFKRKCKKFALPSENNKVTQNDSINDCSNYKVDSNQNKLITSRKQNDMKHIDENSRMGTRSKGRCDRSDERGLVNSNNKNIATVNNDESIPNHDIGIENQKCANSNGNDESDSSQKRKSLDNMMSNNPKTPEKSVEMQKCILSNGKDNSHSSQNRKSIDIMSNNPKTPEKNVATQICTISTGKDKSHSSQNRKSIDIGNTPKTPEKSVDNINARKTLLTEFNSIKITNRKKHPSFSLDKDVVVVLKRSIFNENISNVVTMDQPEDISESIKKISKSPTSVKVDHEEEDNTIGTLQDQPILTTSQVSPRARVLRSSSRCSTEDKIRKGQRPVNEDINNAVSYADLDLFNDEPPEKKRKEESNDKESKIIDPQQSVLCKMIDKYGVSTIRTQAPKISEDVVTILHKKIEKTVTHIIELPASESSKDAMNKFVDEVHKWKFNEFLSALIVYLKDPSRKLELYNKVSTPPAPAMTKCEQVLLYVVTRLEGAWPGINVVDSILKQIEYTLFKLNGSPEFDAIESMAHFYAVLCRYIKAKSRLRLFILDAMYCINFKAVPLIKQCLDVWMHILPLGHMGIAKSPLVTAIVYLLHFFKNKEDRFHRVQEIRNILAHRYFFNFSDWNETKVLEMFKNAVMELRDSPIQKKMLRLALIILAKRQGPRWCQSKLISSMLMSLVTKENTPEKTKAFCISMLGPLLKPYPADMKVHCEIIMNQLIDLLGTNPSSKMQEAIYTSLINMSKHNQNRVLKALLMWQSKELSLEMENVLEYFVREKPVKIWKTVLMKIPLKN